MSVEFIGFITNNNSSETIVRNGPVLDRHSSRPWRRPMKMPASTARLLAFHSTTPDGLQVGQHVLGVTDRLNVLIAQRPGFTAPTLIARQLATVDQLYGGRVALHVIHRGQCHRVEAGWQYHRRQGRALRPHRMNSGRGPADGPARSRFPMDGKYYQVQNGFSQVKPYRSEGIPIFVGGGSDAAIEVAGKHADTFALWGESYAQVRDVTSRVRAAGGQARTARAALQPVDPADSRRYRGRGMGEGRGDSRARHRPAGQDRLSQTGRRSCDRRRAPAAGAGGAGHPHRQAAVDGDRQAYRRQQQHHRALVGTPAQVAEVFGDYYDLGVSHFLIRGFDPLIDAIEYGRELIPLTRKLIAERSHARGVAAA